jgi:hypothetical protein
LLDIFGDEYLPCLSGQQRQRAVQQRDQLVALECFLHIERVGQIEVAATIKGCIAEEMCPAGQLAALVALPGAADVARDSGEPCGILFGEGGSPHTAPGRRERLLHQVFRHVHIPGQMRAPTHQLRTLIVECTLQRRGSSLFLDLHLCSPPAQSTVSLSAVYQDARTRSKIAMMSIKICAQFAGLKTISRVRAL